MGCKPKVLTVLIQNRSGESCDSCLFWNSSEPATLLQNGNVEWGSDLGKCRKNPPVLLTKDAENGKTTEGWPETFDDQWCGGYQRNPDYDRFFELAKNHAEALERGEVLVAFTAPTPPPG